MNGNKEILVPLMEKIRMGDTDSLCLMNEYAENLSTPNSRVSIKNVLKTDSMPDFIADLNFSLHDVQNMISELQNTVLTMNRELDSINEELIYNSESGYAGFSIDVSKSVIYNDIKRCNACVNTLKAIENIIVSQTKEEIRTNENGRNGKVHGHSKEKASYKGNER